MSLTLVELDKYEGDLRIATPPKRVVTAILPALIEYARERAAREACQEWVLAGGVLWCDAINTTLPGYQYTASVVYGEPDMPNPNAYGATPTAAYLALRDRLEADARARLDADEDARSLLAEKLRDEARENDEREPIEPVEAWR
jgi:hypothetical protein